MPDSIRPYRLKTTRLLCPLDSPDKNTRVGCHALLQGIFPTQGSNTCLEMAGRFFTIEPPGKPHLEGVEGIKMCLYTEYYGLWKQKESDSNHSK